jgi:hypothetical protein
MTSGKLALKSTNWQSTTAPHLHLPPCEELGRLTPWIPTGSWKESTHKLPSPRNSPLKLPVTHKKLELLNISTLTFTEPQIKFSHFGKTWKNGCYCMKITPLYSGVTVKINNADLCRDQLNSWVSLGTSLILLIYHIWP